MTKDVLVSISGMHEEIVAVTPEVEDDENEAIEVVTPATYYLKNGKHYIVYEEVVEGTSGVIKNRIKINEINVTTPGGGDSTNVDSLEFDLMSDGKPTYTPAGSL